MKSLWRGILDEVLSVNLRECCGSDDSAEEIVMNEATPREEQDVRVRGVDVQTLQVQKAKIYEAE
jgi:hypothetical protein